MKITILEESINFPLSLMQAEGYSHEAPAEIKANSEKLWHLLFWKNEEKNEIGFYHKRKAVCINLEKEPIFSISHMTPAKGGGFVSFEVVYKNTKGTFSILESEVFSSNSLNWLMQNKQLLESLVGSNIELNDYGADY